MEENLASTLCYSLGIVTGVLFLVLQPYNRNREIRFHAFQSIFLTIAVFVALISIPVLSSVVSIIAPAAGVTVWMSISIVWFLSPVLWFWMMVRTYFRRKWVLPIIGRLAEKQAG